MTDISYSCFDVTLDGAIAHVVMSRPEKRNNMNRAFWDELPDVIERLDADAQARVIVISSTGPHFCGGIDVSMFAPDPQAPQPTKHSKKQRPLTFLDTAKRMQHSFTSLENCRLPVLIAVQGGCIGGGVDMVTAADMRYATKDAFFTIYETKIGMTADVGTFPRIVKLMPEGVVRELAYTGGRLSAEDALRYGLVNRLYDTHEDMLAGVMAIAEEIAANAPLAVHGCKRAITHARDHTTQETLDWIALWNASMMHVDEIGEAMQARSEERAADFADLPPRKIG